MIYSKILTRMMIISIVIILFTSMVLSHPTAMTGPNQTDVSEANIAAFVGQEKNVTIAYSDPNSAKTCDEGGSGDSGDSSTIHFSASNSPKDSLAEKMILAVLVAITLIVMLTMTT
ncbi:hypothetical protein GGR54DRAFT_623280 [Hypoxylon sp. NC1633]|nr:hypothetical protein GGR54DRAFT_623280 [Hypoxylon sp. NC1633]